ncbi:MAG: PA14 domain-containing protein, partial [Planctomycetota bacterium]
HMLSERPDVDEEPGRPFDMEGVSSDLLVAGSEDIYMFQKRFSEDLSVEPMPRITKLGDRRAGLHLMTNDGLLDKTWFNRTFWTYSTRWPGYYLAPDAPKSGQLLVFDDEHTYGVKFYREWHGLSPEFRPGQGYKLFADRNSNEPGLDPTAIGREKGEGFSRTQPPAWTKNVPVRVQAMVLARDHLYVAGPPDLGPGKAAQAAIRGRRGACFRVVAAEDGQVLSGFEMDSVPAFDGLIAAYDRLYMTTQDGAVVSFRPDSTPPNIESARAFKADRSRMLVTFDERVTADSAGDVSHYRIDPDIEVRSAELRETGRTVELTTSALEEGASYSVQVEGVTDRSRAANSARGTIDVTCRPRQPGVVRSYYEGKWQALPDFGRMEPRRTDVVKEIGAIGGRSKNYFGLQFEGQLRVPEDGEYRFFLASDDGSRLFVGGELVVSNDGVHGTRERSGVVKLDSGLHSIRVDYFEAQGGQDLKVTWSGPGFDQRELPADRLCHDPARAIK